MKFIEEATYQLWAEKSFFELLSKVSDEDWSKNLPEFGKSLQSIYIHKYEVMYAWFTLIYVKDSKKIGDNPLNIPDFDQLTKDQFIKEALNLFEMVIEYIKTNPDKKITLTVEWVKKPYEITTHEIIYNFLNHLAYHRGQTAYHFKKLGLTVPETDYNPYMYKLRKLQ